MTKEHLGSQISFKSNNHHHHHHHLIIMTSGLEVLRTVQSSMVLLARGAPLTLDVVYQ